VLPGEIGGHLHSTLVNMTTKVFIIALAIIYSAFAKDVVELSQGKVAGSKLK